MIIFERFLLFNVTICNKLWDDFFLTRSIVAMLSCRHAAEGEEKEKAPGMAGRRSFKSYLMPGILIAKIRVYS